MRSPAAAESANSLRYKRKRPHTLLFILARVQNARKNWGKLDIVAALTSTLLFIAFCSHRLAAYRINTRTWVKPPINDIERPCPPPPYAVDATKYQNSKICITTLTDSAKAGALHKLLRWRNFDNLLEMTWPNKQKYADKHDYFLFNESETLDTTRPPSWSKIRAARRLLTEEKCDWVFWMDADTVIMNSEKRIQDFLPMDDGRDLVVTPQKGGSFNAGAWLIRNTPWSLEFLDTWWNMDNYVQTKGLSTSGDNAALKAFLLGMDKDYFDKHIAVPPRCTFNSVAAFLTPSASEETQMKEMLHDPVFERYQKGDFVAHVAGFSNKITTVELLLKDAV